MHWYCRQASTAAARRPLGRALLSGTALTGALAGAVLFAGPADAANFLVSNTNDAGAGSFRQAIINANATAGTNTITFANGLGTITLTSGDLPAVQNNVTILGNNATLSGNNQFRGLFIGAWTPGTATQAPVTVTIQDLAIANAKAQGGGGGERRRRRCRPRRRDLRRQFRQCDGEQRHSFLQQCPGRRRRRRRRLRRRRRRDGRRRRRGHRLLVRRNRRRRRRARSRRQWWYGWR